MKITRRELKRLLNNEIKLLNEGKIADNYQNSKDRAGNISELFDSKYDLVEKNHIINEWHASILGAFTQLERSIEDLREDWLSLYFEVVNLQDENKIRRKREIEASKPASNNNKRRK